MKLIPFLCETCLVALLALTSQAGQRYRWTATLSAGDGDQKVATDGMGNTYVVGTVQLGDAGWHLVAVKYSPRGQQLWRQNYKTYRDGAENFRALAVDDAGNLCVNTITFDFGTGSNSITVLKYDSGGNLLWTRNRPGEPSQIAVDRSGNVYACGRDEHWQNWLAKYAANGQQIWERTFRAPANTIGAAYALALDSAGNVCVTGFEYSLFKFDPAGSLLWQRDYFGQRGTRVLLDSHDNVYVMGITFVPDTLTVKLDGEGRELWRATYANPAAEWTDPVSAVIDTTDNLYLATRSGGGHHNLAKYSSDGRVLWRTGETGGWDEGFVPGLAVDRRGDAWLFFTAKLAESSYDAVLVQYDVLGRRKGFTRFDHGQWDFSGDMFVNEKNRLVFTYTASFDWVTAELRH